jgi:glucans biosynthesis protein C
VGRTNLPEAAQAGAAAAVASAETTAAAPGERIHALDAVRGFALLCGVAMHAAVAFVPGQPIWVIADADRSIELTASFFVLHIFRMTTFFMIAGFFGRMLVERLGTARFVRDRLKRIAAPLVAFWLIVFPLVVLVLRWADARNGSEPLTVIATPGGGGFLLHLWFLWMLLLLYAAAVMLRTIAGSLAARLDPIMRSVAGHPVPVLLALPTFAAFMLSPGWLGWFGVPTPEASLVPNAIALTAYGTAFGFGWLLHRQPSLIQGFARDWALHLGLAAVLIAACLMTTGPLPVVTPEPRLEVRLVYAACYALAMWNGTFAVIGLAVRFLSGHSPVRRYLADASYWIYLLHLPLVMALQVLVADLAWPWSVKFAFILGTALAILICSYQLLVRNTLIGVWLNNRRGRESPAKAARLA